MPCSEGLVQNASPKTDQVLKRAGRRNCQREKQQGHVVRSWEAKYLPVTILSNFSVKNGRLCFFMDFSTRYLPKWILWGKSFLAIKTPRLLFFCCFFFSFCFWERKKTPHDLQLGLSKTETGFRTEAQSRSDLHLLSGNQRRKEILAVPSSKTCLVLLIFVELWYS